MKAVRGRFFIVSEFVRASEFLIAEKGTDGKLRYIHPKTTGEGSWPAMSFRCPTPVEDFGIQIDIEYGALIGRQVGDSNARYHDGHLRKWWGEPQFAFATHTSSTHVWNK